MERDVDKNKENQKPRSALRKAYDFLDQPLAAVIEKHILQSAKLNPLDGASLPDDKVYRKQSTFRPLMNEQVKREALGQTIIDKDSDPKLDEHKKTSVLDCFKQAIAISWKAGKGYLLTTLLADVSSSALPYGIAFAGAKLTDALVLLSKNPQAAADAQFWFAATVAGSLGLIALGSIRSYASLHHQIAKNALINQQLRESLSAFPPSVQISPEGSSLTNLTQKSIRSLETFGSNLLRFAVPIASTAGALVVIAPYSPLGSALLAMFTVPYLYHSQKRGEDELRMDSAVSEIERRVGTRGWGLLTGAGQVNVRINGKNADLVEHVNEEEIQLDVLRRKPQISQQFREAWLKPLNAVSLGAIGYVILQDVISATTSGVAGPSIGQYGMITAALYSLNGSITSLAEQIGDFIENFPRARLAVSVVQKGMEYRDFEKKGIPLVLEQAPMVKVQNLNFSYPSTTKGEPPLHVLKGLNFEIKPGELLAIVGESGGGKTSLVDLFAGIYEADSGSISINGLDINDIQKSSLWASAGYYRQWQPNFWSMTLRENILIGAQKAISDEEIMRHAEENGFAAAMRKNNLTLDTIMGQWFKGGTDLSGGEHTRLSLTRQAVTEAKFMIFDEPNNGLDPAMADKIINRIINMEDVTRVLIVHDYAIAASADRILVLKDGLIEDIGTHSELVQRCETYATAVQRQQKKLSAVTL